MKWNWKLEIWHAFQINEFQIGNETPKIKETRRKKSKIAVDFWCEAYFGETARSNWEEKEKKKTIISFSNEWANKISKWIDAIHSTRKFQIVLPKQKKNTLSIYHLWNCSARLGIQDKKKKTENSLYFSLSIQCSWMITFISLIFVLYLYCPMPYCLPWNFIRWVRAKKKKKRSACIEYNEMQSLQIKYKWESVRIT